MIPRVVIAVIVFALCGPEVRAQDPFLSPGEIVLSSQENTVPLTPDQLNQLGWSSRLDAAGRVQWFRPVPSKSLSSGEVLSLRGDCGDGSSGSSQLTLRSGST